MSESGGLVRILEGTEWRLEQFLMLWTTIKHRQTGGVVAGFAVEMPSADQSHRERYNCCHKQANRRTTASPTYHYNIITHSLHSSLLSRLSRSTSRVVFEHAMSNQTKRDTTNRTVLPPRQAIPNDPRFMQETQELSLQPPA